MKSWLDGADNFGIAIVPDGARIEIDSKENKKTSHPMEIEVSHRRTGDTGLRSIIGGGTRDQSLDSASDRFVPMFYGSSSEVETEVEQAMPVKGIVSDFFVFLEGDPGDDSSLYQFTVRRDPAPIGGTNGDVADTDDPIRCTIDGTLDSTGPFFFCTDPGSSQCYEAGDLIDIEADPFGDPDGQSMRWTALFTPCACTGTTCD